MFWKETKSEKKKKILQKQQLMSSFTSSGETKEDNDVKKLLRDLNLVEYFQKFMDEGYDTLDRLANIVLEDLLEIGLLRGHARQFLREIQSRKANNNLRQYDAEPVLAPNLEPSKRDMTTDPTHPPTEFNHNQWYVFIFWIYIYLIVTQFLQTSNT